jgi:hypothetical protein
MSPANRRWEISISPIFVIPIEKPDNKPPLTIVEMILHGVRVDKNNASRHCLFKVILLHFLARTRSGCLFYLFIIYIYFFLKKVSKFVNNLKFLSTDYPVRWSFDWLSFFFGKMH